MRIRLPRTASYADASGGDPSDGHMRSDNRLALLDQAFYSGHRAAGQKEVMQVGWLYEHPLDLDELKRFHRDLAYGLLGRRIERSPLPFGRYRWVSDRQPSELDIAERARPRAEVGDWLDECSQLPIDAESGPAWRLSVLPLTDGSTAVTLVMSHYVIDGLGGVIAVTLAILGDTRDYGYPPPRSRKRLHALLQDAGEAARGTPAAGRALVAALREAQRRRRDGAPSVASRGVVGTETELDEPVLVPGISLHIDIDQWDSRAAALGGTESTLAAALTAKLGEHMGRRKSDGEVTIWLLVSQRTATDTRAVAVSFARASIDPTHVTSDLGAARTAIKNALQTLRETPDQAMELAPMTPFTPNRTWRQLVDYALDDPDQPAVCSNLGEAGPVVTRPDGTHAEYAYVRGRSQHVTRRWVERTGGQLQVFYGRASELNRICIHILGYQPGGVTTRPALRDLVARTLAEFDLTAEID